MSNQSDKTTEAAKPFDTVGFIIQFETGGLNEEQIVEGFQHLIDSGVVWQLQGSYARAAQSLIENGLCTASNPKAFNLSR